MALRRLLAPQRSEHVAVVLGSESPDAAPLRGTFTTRRWGSRPRSPWSPSGRWRSGRYVGRRHLRGGLLLSGAPLKRRPQPGGATPGYKLLGHLARGFVDHLVAKHDRAPTLHLGGLAVGVDDSHRLVEIGLARGEGLVARLDLAWVDGPLTVVAESSRPGRDLAKTVEVPDQEIRTVDDLDAGGPGRHSQLEENVVEDVTGVGVPIPDGERGELHRRREVGRTVGERLQPGACEGNLLS